MAQDQRVEWLLAAQVTGQNELSRLTAAVEQLRKETAELRQAQSSLGATQDAVVRATGRTRNALDEQSKAMRNARQGTQQLGMQVNDFMTSVSTGASPIQAFNQQIGQVGYAMSMMGGMAGRIGNFLAGPWSILILGASMAIGYLYDKFTAASEAGAELQVISSSLGSAQSALGDMFDLSTGKIKSNTTETRLNTLAKIANLKVTAAEQGAKAKAQYTSVVEPGYFQRVKNTASDITGAIYTPGAGVLPGIFNPNFVKNLDNNRKGVQALYKVADTLFVDMANGSKTAAKEIENLFQKGDTKFRQYLIDKQASMAYTEAAKAAQASFDQGAVAASLLRPTRTTKKKDKPEVLSETDKLRLAQEAIIAAYERGDLSLAEFETKLVSVTEAFKDARKPAEDWLNQFKEANKDVEKFKDLTEKLTSKSVPQYINTLRDLENRYEGLQKNDKMTAELQIGFRNAIKATATGPIDELIKKYDAMHTGTTQMQQDLIAAKAVMDALSKETGEAAGVGFQAASEAYDKLKKAMADAEIRERNQEIADSFKSIGNAVSDAFQGMLTGATSFKDGMKSIISSVISELWRLYVVQQIVGFFTGTVGPALGFGLPGKAMGGSVGKNQPYMVGERGPELFIPGGSGTIIPNRNLGNGSGGNAFSINVDARGSADPAAVRAQVQQGILEAAPAIIAAAEARTVNGLRRPRLGGVMQ